MTRKSGSSVLTKVAAFLLIIVLLGVIAVGVWLGVETQGFKDWTYFNGEQTEQPAEEEQPEEEQPSDVTDGEGNEMMSGTAYALPTAMVYSATTRDSASASEGVTVTATVLPETAIDKSVTWNVAFANAESEWASGKTVTDYLTVTPDEEDSRIAVLTCNEAFGEQIILTCASVSDPTKTATCTVDFAQKVTGVTVKIGNVDVVLGGDTEVTVDIGHDNTDRGGVISIEYQLSEVYTIAEEGVTTSVELMHAEPFMSTDEDIYFGCFMNGGGLNYGHSYDDIEDAVGESLYFDSRMFTSCNFIYWYLSQTGSSEQEKIEERYDSMDISRKKMFCDERMDKILWTLTATATGTYGTYTAQSDIVLAAVDGWDQVEEITLDPSEIVFP